ncbi:Hypothetical predicted protein [Cloeon dipterum]|uniref:Macro domain-containing protein n=1 Tax=Cloeon dipterum TaxID=197152 RepID=A0A8S1CIF5_9INSE|nr:Hypothetical predicted protein [Cloeon dipterum]
MPLDKKRKYYDKDHVSLESLPTWPQFAEKESLTTAAQPKAKVDDEINSKVSLFEGDITTLEIDAIVNAANSSLSSGGGVCGAIFRAAGGKLDEECDALKGCPAGQAKLTGGYKLPAKYILHAVGPQDEDPVVLKKCYINCLDHMLQTEDSPDLRSLAFPCIATGIYGFPNDKAAEIAISTSREFLDKNKDQVDRIIFCLFDKIDKKLYRKLMPIYFPLKSAEETTNDQ